MALVFTSDNTRLIAAVHDGALANWAATNNHDAAATLCRGIGERTAAEAAEIQSHLRRASIDLGDPAGWDSSGGPAEGGQLHALEWQVSDGAAANAAVDALRSAGFEPWETDSVGGRAAIQRLSSVMTTARTTDVTVAVRFRWQPTGVGRLLPRALRPTAADYGALDVPAPLWPVYLLTRPLRLLAERTGRREPAPASLGPFLSTPAELLGPLLEFASLTSEDVLVDVGSGDGRLPIEAARSTGCRAKGIEHDPGLVSQAALAAETAGVTDKVTFVVGDAARADLSAATVVFIFLPANVTARLIEPIAASLQPGSRIIAHEQHALSGAPTPSVSLAIGAGQGMTVAHRWDI